MNTLTYRQGDVIFREAAALPPDAEPADDRVVARGELTDHSHVVYGEAVRVFQDKKNNLYVDTRLGAAVIRHVLESRHRRGAQQWTGEHRTLLLPRGKIYRVRQQREYDPFTGLKWIVGD